jgi:protein O-mannosyl-transferase
MTEETQTDRERNRRCIVLIVLVGMIAWFNTFSGVFLFDDGYTIVYNEKVNDISLERMKLGRAFVGYVNALNHLADGANPRGYHLVNLVTHLLATLALFGLVRRTLLLERWPDRVRDASRPLALAIAVLWMVHPLQTASVTYIIQRCESMMGMFYLLTIYCFMRGATARSSFWWYVTSICCGLIGNACKEVIVTAPMVILAYDWVFLRPRFWELIRKRWWYYLLLTGLIGLTFVYWHAKAVVSGTNSYALGFDYPWHGPWEYLMSQSHVILHYIRLAFWPDLLCFDYQDWEAIRSWRQCWLQGSILSVAFLFSLFGILMRWWLGFAIFAFFAILAPTSSIMPIQDLIFDHRMYLSLAPLICVVVGIGWSTTSRIVDRGWFPLRAMSYLRCAIVIGLTIALAIATMFRNDDYQSRLTIWADCIKKRPNCVRAMTEVSSQLYKPDTAEEAYALARRAVELSPNYSDARYYYGVMLFDHDELDEAVEQFHYAYRLRPEAWLYPRHEGICHLAAGRPNSAVEALRRALDNLQSDNWTKMLLAIAEHENDNPEAAEALFAEIRAANDATWVTAYNEARLCAFRDQPTTGQKRMAIHYARGAVRITEGKRVELLDTLAVAFSINDRFDEAQQVTERAIALAEQRGDTAALKVLKYRLERYKQQKKLEFGACR